MGKDGAWQYKSLDEHAKRLAEMVEYIVRQADGHTEKCDISLEAIDMLYDINLEFNDAVMCVVSEMLNERPEISGVNLNNEGGALTVYPSRIEIFRAEKEAAVSIHGMAYINSQVNTFAEFLDEYDPTSREFSLCIIEKIINLPSKEFFEFGNALTCENNLVNDNQALQYVDAENKCHCIFVKPSIAEYGILICNETTEGVLHRGYLPNLNVFRERLEQSNLLQESANSLIATCNKNIWLGNTREYPLYDYDYCFTEVLGVDELKEAFEHGNWGIRQGFVFNDLAFVQQVNGGDEWLALRKEGGEWKSFDSISFEHILRSRGEEYFKRYMERLINMTAEQNNLGTEQAVQEENTASSGYDIQGMSIEIQ